MKTKIVAVSYDSQEVLAEFAKQNKVTFALLSDPESKVIDAYGVRKEGAEGRQDGIPHPTTFVIGQDSMIKGKLPGEVRVRHTTKQLVDELKKLQ